MGIVLISKYYNKYTALYIFIDIGQLNFVKLCKIFVNYAYIVVKMFHLLYIVVCATLQPIKNVYFQKISKEILHNISNNKW